MLDMLNNEGSPHSGGRRALLALPVLLALAAGVPHRAGAGVEPVTRWDPKLDRLEADLERGRGSVRTARRIYEAMITETAGFEFAPRALARAASLLALTEAQDGRTAEAIWHWHAAHALDRRAVPGDLGRFGAAGALLTERSPRRLGELPARLGGPVPAALTRRAQPAEGSAVHAGVSYCRPAGHLRGQAPPPVTVEVVVAADGRPHEPVLQLPSRHPGFALAVLESIRAWSFEPAVDDRGEPVASLTVVTVPYPA